MGLALLQASATTRLTPTIVADVATRGRNISHVGGGVLNTFCTDPAHGLGHQLSALVSFDDLLPLQIRNYRGCAGFLDEGVNAILDRLGVKNRQHVLSDSFGYPGIACFGDDGRTVSTDGGCELPGGSDGQNWTRWESVVESVVRGAVAGGRTDVQFDVWNEPDGGFWSGASESQFHEAWARAVRVIRRISPQSMVVGPSMACPGGFGEPSRPTKQCAPSLPKNVSMMRRFFDAARASDTLPDIVSWHEWAPNGQNIIGHVQEMTDWLDREGIAYEGISVNEMIIWDEWGQPGSTVANWAALESVGSAGCRSAPDAGTSEQRLDAQACPNTMALPLSGAIDTNWFPGVVVGGALRFAVPTPPANIGGVTFERRSVWYAHEAYGNLSGQLLNISRPGFLSAMVTVAPPSAGERGGSVRAVIGANGGHSPQLLQNVTLLLRGCGGAAARTANIAHIRPDTVCQSEANGGNCSTDVGRSTPLYSTVQVAQAAAGSLRLALPPLEPQDVLSLRIEPGCG